VSGRETIKALQGAGFEVVRQRGSHVTLIHREKGVATVVPVHGNRDLPTGTLAVILREAGLTPDELRRLLR
jgi:predicted RNA binding protein YcfA (HicA-like mRNA interferase family)